MCVVESGDAAVLGESATCDVALCVAGLPVGGCVIGSVNAVTVDEGDFGESGVVGALAEVAAFVSELDERGGDDGGGQSVFVAFNTGPVCEVGRCVDGLVAVGSSGFVEDVKGDVG